MMMLVAEVGTPQQRYTETLFLDQVLPLRMNEPKLGLVNPFIRVRAEEVALRLRQVERQVRGAVGVEVSEARRHRLHRDARRLRGRDGLPPARLGFEDPRLEVGVEQQIGQVGAALVRLLDLVQELRADDAAALPDAAQLAEVDVPVPLVRPGADQVHALGVGADLARVEGVVDGVNQLLLVAGVFETRRAGQLFAGFDAFALEGRHRAPVNRGLDRRDRNGEGEPNLLKPFSFTFPAGLVEYQVNQRFLRLRVNRLEDLR